MKISAKTIVLPLSMLLTASMPAHSLEIPWMDRSENVFGSELPAFVDDAILAYENKGRAVFSEFSDTNNSTWVKDDGFTYIFVVDPDEKRTLAHGGLLQSKSRKTGIKVKRGDDTHLALKMLIHVSEETPDGRFAHLDWDDPASEKTYIKRYWLKMHDGLIFASGEFIDFPGAQYSDFVISEGD